MKRFLLKMGVLSLPYVAMLACLPTVGATRSYLGGTIFTRHGQLIEVVRFFEPLQKEDVLTGKVGEETVKIPIGDILELNLLTADSNYMYQHSKFVTQTGIVTLVQRDGKTRLLTDAYFDRGTLAYTILGPDRTLQEQQIRFRDVVKIRFDVTTGKVRSCPLDQAVFPDDYLFCPYHGVPLIWR